MLLKCRNTNHFLIFLIKPLIKLLHNIHVSAKPKLSTQIKLKKIVFLPQDKTVSKAKTMIRHLFVQVSTIQLQQVQKSKTSNGTYFCVQV